MMMTLNYSKLLGSKETPAYAKEAIRQLQQKGSLTVGQFIQTMASADILSAVECYKDFMSGLMSRGLLGKDQPGDPIGDSFLIFMEILAAGEGLDLDLQISVLAPRLQYLSIYLGVELMARRGGPVLLHYENMTLSEEIATSIKPIVSIKPGAEIEEATRKKILLVNDLLRLTPTRALSKDELEILKAALMKAAVSEDGSVQVPDLGGRTSRTQGGAPGPKDADRGSLEK